MPSRQKKSRKKNVSKRAALVLTALLAFMLDNSNLTSASSFESSSQKSTGHRLPSEISKPVLEFDCNKPMDKLEVSTVFENIRLNATNCKEKLAMRSNANKLVTFPIGENKFSSEFAYLARGQNFFIVSSGGKDFKITVFRF